MRSIQNIKKKIQDFRTCFLEKIFKNNTDFPFKRKKIQNFRGFLRCKNVEKKIKKYSMFDQDKIF